MVTHRVASMVEWTLIVLVCALWLAPVAPAATVTLRIRQDLAGDEIGTTTFQAGRGERNRVTLRDVSGWNIFSDAANPVHARGDCRQQGPRRARCPVMGDVRLNLGDGDDTLRMPDVSDDVAVRGGPGNDVLSGGAGYDVLSGGRGDDTLHGGAADDRLTGGPGRDRLFGGPGDDELIDGETDAEAAPDLFVGGTHEDQPAGSGPGDVVSYARRRRPVRIDLATGATSTEDQLRGIESLTGGHGDDRLSGDTGSNWLEGGPGRDVIHGGSGDDVPMGGPGNDRVYGDGGNDVVWGDSGRDRLFGGDGNDYLISLENRGRPASDRLDCGTGADDARSGSEDTLSGGCERLSALSNEIEMPTQPTIDHGSAEFSVTCTDGVDESCSGSITLSGPDGSQLGRSHFDVPIDSTSQVTVGLTPAGDAAVGAGEIIRVDVRRDDAGIDDAGGYRMVMRAPGS